MLKKTSPYAGIIGPAIFTLSFLINGCLRPGYDPVRMYVSELSIGPQGWIQMASFVFLGLCLLIFALGLPKYIPSGRASRAGFILLLIIAVCYIASGPLVTDPLSMFDNQQTAQGMAHGIFGALVFALSPACCFVFYGRFRADERFLRLKTWTLLAGIIMTLIIVLMKLAQPQASPLNRWAGLIQRCSLVIFYVWITSFALRLRKTAGGKRHG